MQQQPVMDSYVSRRIKSSDTSGSNDQSVMKTLAAKSNAVRRLEQIGRRAKFVTRNRSASAA